MWTGLRWLRCLALVICCVLLVLLVPSSAWSAGTGSPASSASSSPWAGSWLVSRDDPTPAPVEASVTPPIPGESESPGSPMPPSSSPASSPSGSESASSPGSPEQSAPSSSSGLPGGCGTVEVPCVVEPTTGAVGFLALVGGLMVAFLAGLFVRSFAG